MVAPKVLYIIRHGEAELGTGFGGDFKRVLTASGKKQIHRIAQMLLARAVTFDLILSSSALRTKETTEILLQLVHSHEIRFSENLYEADPSNILELINQTPPEVDHLLIVGHNPAVSAIATYLTETPYISIKPGMLVKIEIFQESWEHIGKSTGILAEVFQ